MHILIIFFAKYLFILPLVIALIAIFKAGSSIRHEIIKLIVVSFPISFILAKIGSHIFYNPRPFVSDHLQPLISHSADNGFPSDHTLLAATLAIVFLAYQRKLGIFLLILSILIGAARVLANVHHPIDIIGSIIFAFIAVSIALIVLKRIKVINNLVGAIPKKINL